MEIDGQRHRLNDRERRTYNSAQATDRYKTIHCYKRYIRLEIEIYYVCEFSPKMRYVINNVRPMCLFIFNAQPRFDTRKILIHSNPQVIWVNKAIDDKDDDDDEKRELIMCGGFGKPLPAHASLYHCLGRHCRSCYIFTSKHHTDDVWFLLFINSSSTELWWKLISE